MRPPNAQNNAAINAAANTYKAEYQRLWQAFQYLFAPIDDTPLVANHTKKNRPTVQQVRQAAANPALVPKTALKHEIVNAIIAAALHEENETRHPGTTIHNGGILTDHEGHLAVDETHIATGSWGLPRNKAPGNFTARTLAHSKVYKGAPSLVGLTIATTVARPTQSHDVPLVALGATLHHPTGGLGRAVVSIVDAITTNDLNRPTTSNQGKYVVVDGGYTEAIDLNRNLTNRGFGMVMKFAKDQEVIHEIGATTNPDGNRTPGIWLFNGRPLCPGAAQRALRRTKLKVPDFHDRKNKYDGTVRPYSGKELHDHEQLLDSVRPLIMKTDGRPKETLARKRGGQSKTAPPPEPVMQVTLRCPASGDHPTARCELWSDFYDPGKAHLPIVPNPPIHIDNEDALPACCKNDSGTIQARIPLNDFKDWQDLLVGTWEHADWYSGPRSANERYNSYLKHATGGVNLNKGTIEARKAAPFAIFTALAIAHANRRSIESWYARLTRKAGIKPTVRAAANKARRDNDLKAYLAASGAASRTASRNARHARGGNPITP